MSHTWGYRATTSPFGPPVPQFRVKSKSRWLKPDQVDYWVGALQLLFYKCYLKMIDHSSRSTWGPWPSRSRLWIQKCDLAPKKLRCYLTFVFAKHHGWGCRATTTPFCFPNPCIRVKGKSRMLKLDQVDYLEGVLQCLFYKLCLKMIEICGAHVLPGADFGSKNMLCPY